jgi:hypothetical protein
MSNSLKSFGKTEIRGINDGKNFNASNSVSASGNTINESLDAVFYTSKKQTVEMLNYINSENVPEIIDYKLILTNENDIDRRQVELQNLTQNDYYYTYYDTNYITYEPVRYLNDVFSVSFNFWFSKEEEITPYFYFVKDGVTSEYRLNKINSKIDSFINISFGPFQKRNQKDRPTEVYIALKTNTNIIFFKHHKILNFDDYTFRSMNNLNLNFMLVSCLFVQNPNVPDLFNKFTTIAKKNNANFVLSLGDIIYIDSSDITSQISMQTSYTELKEYSSLQGLFSNSTWITCNDDHEFSYNDGNKNAPIIKILRDKFSDNFPIVSQVSNDYRANIQIISTITFIALDVVSCRTLNPKPKDKYDQFLTILGTEQLQFLLDGLSNVYSSFGENGLCFVLVGKSMFGEQSDATFLYCPSEREKIFNYIKDLGLRNVCFLCGDSHFSDVSEYIVNVETNQIVREIRCSALGAKPRIGDINESRVPGSLVNINNFGKMNIQGNYTNYNVKYEDYTLDDVAFKYNWNINY